MTFLDLFSGIGGFRLGMERAGHTCIGHVEKDKFARMSYKAIHKPKENEFCGKDITKITDEEWRTLRGFEDIRGTMFFEVARAAKQIQPHYLLLENVKGLLSHDKGETFRTILNTLDELGYDAEWQVLNSKDFGVPQNRERVFIIGHLRGTGGREVFPLRNDDKEAFIKSTQNANTITARYGEGLGTGMFVVENQSPQIIQKPRGHNRGGIKTISPTVSANSFHENNFVIKGEWGESKTPLNDKRIRKLTPRECWRLQGFPDWAFDRAKEAGVSDSQLYKQTGNSVTVNVIEEIARRLD